ncbi:GGDEF domain-containing protein [Ectothiorhodospiraceae bacterium WFHF3C12]|nr:GGDEF domain-containing protein [Ectothiorhodospiraceae bacterium WFHF3C12]
MSRSRSGPSTEAAQRLRLRRALLGVLANVFTASFAVGYYAAGIVAGAPLAHYLAALVILNAVFLALIASGRNLRFSDPSLTDFQVIAPLWPSIYIMYFLTVPQARMTFLLMALVGMLFATLAYGIRRLLGIASVIVFSYLLLLAALLQWAPERIDLRVEVVIVFAYAVVLLLIAFIGNQVAALRRVVKARNRELESAVAELRELATLDPLTRLPNRRSIMDHLLQEESRAERRTPEQNSLCLCLVDVDHFKRINDTYGHQVGDRALQQVADALVNVLRKGDFVGRYGGEEFLLILPESTREGARIAADRVRRHIEQSGMSALESAEHLTVSIGVAVHSPGDSVEKTLGRADAALYEAKGKGRNQVVLAGEEKG